MNTTPVFYRTHNQNEIEKFISTNFNCAEGNVFHEITSEYVHSDVIAITPENDQCTFITMGMGARKMNSPTETQRCELIMHASKGLSISGEKSRIIANELIRISKFPFRNDTWLGCGHTVDTSTIFKETFGYDYFIFKELPLVAELSDIKEDIKFLLVIPMYKEERDWCIENHSLAFLEELNDIYDGKEYDVDFKRGILIPENITPEEEYLYNIMLVLGIDREKTEELVTFIEELESSNKEITIDLLMAWAKEHK